MIPEEDVPAETIAYSPCSPAQVGPFREPADGRPASAGPADVWVIQVSRAGTEVPGYCATVDQITRPRPGDDPLMASVLRCDAEAVGRRLAPL